MPPPVLPPADYHLSQRAAPMDTGEQQDQRGPQGADPLNTAVEAVIGAAAAGVASIGALVAAEALEQERIPHAGEMQAFASTMISAAGWDSQSQQLAVEFTSGRIYTYQGVPIEVWKALLDAPSKGEFMHSSVLGVFPF